MPYSDNLYSFGDDESDFGTTENPLSQAGGAFSLMAATSQSSPLGTDGCLGVAGDDEEDADVFSPTDGYFSTATDDVSSNNAYSTATSSNVPHVPNVWVQDPSLPEGSTAESKAREAEQERLANRQHDDSFQQRAGTPRNSSPGSSSPHAQAHRSIGSGRTSQSRQAAYSHHSPSSSSSSHSRTPSAAASSSPYTRYYAPPQQLAAYHAGESSSSRFVPEEDPPAYTPSPTSPQPASSLSATSDSSRNYNTFSSQPATSNNMGRWEEQQGLLGHGPQSMRDSYNDSSDGEPRWWREQIRKGTSLISWEKCKTVLLSLVLLLVTAGFLSSLITGIKDERSPRFTPNPSNGKPVMRYPEIDKEFGWQAKSCSDRESFALETKSFDIFFSPDKSLEFVQNVTDSERHGYNPVHIEGTVLVRRTGSSNPGPSVVVETVLSDDRVDVTFSWDADEQKLVVTVVHKHNWDDGPQSCVSIKATVWVPENSSLAKFEIDTIQLDVKLLDNLSLVVAQNTKLSTIVGAITAASSGSDTRDDKIIDIGAPESFQFSSRFIDVKTTAAPIRGSWPLYDYLGLKSTSGNIKACIEPKDADKDKPRPALLSISSNSGNVEFREPIQAAEHAHAISKDLIEAGMGYVSDLKAEAVLPPRDYRVDVHTTSGNIKGAVALSSTASFMSTSGAMTLELLPVLDARLVSDSSSARDIRLTTSSTSGDSDVTVLEPLWVDSKTETYVLPPLPAGVFLPPSIPDAAPDADTSAATFGGGEFPLRVLRSQHSSISADVRLQYPASWEGDISLASLSGKLKMAGEGVKVIKNENDWPGVNKRVLARKGEEGKGGQVTVKTTSGDVDVVVGNK